MSDSMHGRETGHKYLQEKEPEAKLETLHYNGELTRHLYRVIGTRSIDGLKTLLEGLKKHNGMVADDVRNIDLTICDGDIRCERHRLPDFTPKLEMMEKVDGLDNNVAWDTLSVWMPLENAHG